MNERMNEKMYAWMNEWQWINEWCMKEWVAGWTNEWLHERVSGYMNEWVDYINSSPPPHPLAQPM